MVVGNVTTKQSKILFNSVIDGVKSRIWSCLRCWTASGKVLGLNPNVCSPLVGNRKKDGLTPSCYSMM